MNKKPEILRKIESYVVALRGRNYRQRLIADIDKILILCEQITVLVQSYCNGKRKQLVTSGDLRIFESLIISRLNKINKDEDSVSLYKENIEPKEIIYISDFEKVRKDFMTHSVFMRKLQQCKNHLTFCALSLDILEQSAINDVG